MLTRIIKVLRANQRLNKLFKQPMRAQDAESENVMSETTDRLECQSKQIKMNRLQISREKTLHVI